MFFLDISTNVRRVIALVFARLDFPADQPNEDAVTARAAKYDHFLAGHDTPAPSQVARSQP